MNENLDLTKILEGCPEGTEFYSSIFGEVLFRGIDKSNPEYPILVKVSFGTTLKQFTKQGKCYATVGECTLFPDKDQRNWSKFERFWDKPKVERFDPKTLKPFDKVLGFYEAEGGSWECALFSHLNETERSVICVGIIYDKCIPYNDETKHLVGTNNDCPEYYKWWEE